MRDREKTACLARAGYWCIRIREYPLEPICPPDQGTDIVVRSTDPVHMIATAVLKQAVLRFLDVSVHELDDVDAMGAQAARLLRGSSSHS